MGHDLVRPAQAAVIHFVPPDLVSQLAARPPDECDYCLPGDPCPLHGLDDLDGEYESEECYRAGDGKPHDEAFPCEVCDRPVCGYCADAGNGSEWFCPDDNEEKP